MRYVYYISYTWSLGIPKDGGQANWGFSGSEVVSRSEISHIQQLEDIAKWIKKAAPDTSEIVILNWQLLRVEQE